MLELISELQQRPPTEDEVDKAKRRYLWNLRTLQDDTEGAAHFVGTSALFGLPGRIGTVADRVERVTAKDIQQSAQRYLNSKDANLTCVGVLDEGLLSDLRGLAGL